jgi:hypothetical protein
VARRSAAGRVTLSDAAPLVGAMYVVGSVAGALPLITHCTTEHARILLPVTVKDWAGLPTAAEVCDSAGIPGAASAVVGVKMVNGKLLEVPGEALAGSL